MDPYGGGNQSMMSMSASSVSLLACAAIAAGAFYMMNSGPTKPPQLPVQPAVVAASESTSAPAAGAVNPGMYNVVSGGVSMIIDPENCTNTQVGFDDATGSDKQAWNLSPVPGRPGYYYIQSEHRLFKKGCNLSYLTAPAECNGVGATLDTPQWADRQYWQLVPTGNGAYQIRNAACAAKRAPSYLMSSGVNRGMNTFTLSDRSGTAYNFNPVSPS